MGDKQRPRIHIAALYWLVYVTDLCSKRCDRLFDRLATARRVEPRRRDVDFEPTLPPGRSLT
jgi:hypothetical protein